MTKPTIKSLRNGWKVLKDGERTSKEQFTMHLTRAADTIGGFRAFALQSPTIREALIISVGFNVVAMQHTLDQEMVEAIWRDFHWLATEVNEFLA